MKTHLTICNEADYLQAHVTAIVSVPRRGHPVFHDLSWRITSLLKKWIMVANADLKSRSIHLRGIRTASEAERFEAATGPTVSRPKK
jgi:hypothetical protein